MPTVYFIGPNGGEYQVEAQDGDSVMQAALSGMVDGILGECGGQSRCGTCHCYVDENWLNKLDGTSKLEAMILEGVIDPKKNSRLSCNIKITEELKGLVVHIPERQY